MSEASDMTCVADYRNIIANQDPRWQLLTHVPNGGLRHPRVGAQLRAQGVQAGFPDWIFPIPNSLGQILFIEQKFGKNTLSPEQKWWFEQLTGAGHTCLIARSPDQTIGFVRAHLMFK